MGNKFDNASSEMVSHFVATISRVFDRSGADLQLIYDTVVDQLENGPRNNVEEAYGHVAQHFRDIYPVIMSDPRLEDARGRILAEYGRLPATSETRLRVSRDDHSVGFAVVLGGAIGVAVAAAIVAYCLGGDDPAPGESVEVRC